RWQLSGRIVAEALSSQNALAGWARCGIIPGELMQKKVVLEERFAELFTSKKSGAGSLSAPQTSTANALSLVSKISPQKKTRGKHSCKCMVAVTMRFCPECGSENAHYDAKVAQLFKSGRRPGWHKPPEAEPLLPETEEEKKLARGVGDLLSRLRKAPPTSENSEPPAKQRKIDSTPASAAKGPGIAQELPAMQGEGGKEEEEEEESDAEWNLNNVDDCCSFIEHKFPAKEAEALGVNVDMFSKVALFYVNFLRNKRTLKAELRAHFTKEIIEPNTLGSKAGRKNWLQTWLAQRKRVFVPKT
ncbi:DDE-1 domain-containing protein, partial [Durusdinium trenchii]